jgi:tetratricopeptide (TPR) repeat protein
MATSEQPSITPNERKRLQLLFAQGSKMATVSNFDYATQMFEECVQKDPGNLIYVQNFLSNLQRKYNNAKKGSKLAAIQGAGAWGSMKKSSVQKKWRDVINSGLTILKLNPWNIDALKMMGHACEQLQHDEVQIAYLKLAQEVDLKDPEVNRLLGRALARLGKFDDAIVCFQRVRQTIPNDEEATRAIGNLTVQKTIHKGGYEDAKSSTEVMADKDAQADRQGTSGPRLTPEQILEKAIAKNPTDLNLYSELADLHLKFDRLAEAEAVMSKALQASGGEISIRERVEDIQIRLAAHNVAQAKKQAESTRSEQHINLYRQLVEALNRKELEVFTSRSARYPDNLGFKYELAVRLKRAKNYKEAIKLFQESMRGDSKRKGTILLDLGDCFQAIKQYKLALSNYELAVTEIPDREVETRKSVLYRVGKLAAFMRNFELAEKYLNELAGLDFGYKDVSDLLDKLSRLREDGESASGDPLG